MFSRNLIKARNYMDISQKQLALLARISRKNIEKYENNEIHPNIKTSYRLTKILKASYQELFGMIEYEVKPLEKGFGIIESGKPRLIVDTLENALLIRNILEADSKGLKYFNLESEDK